MNTAKVVLCTGGNQGLGYAILQVAGLREPSSIYILACRTVVCMRSRFVVSTTNHGAGLWS